MATLTAITVSVALLMDLLLLPAMLLKIDRPQPTTSTPNPVSQETLHEALATK
jgi:hypothetical protein